MGILRAIGSGLSGIALGDGVGRYHRKLALNTAFTASGIKKGSEGLFRNQFAGWRYWRTVYIAHCLLFNPSDPFSDTFSNVSIKLFARNK